MVEGGTGKNSNAILKSTALSSRSAAHPDLPDPSEIKVADDAFSQHGFDGYIVRAVLSPIQGIEDVDFYVMRWFITFVIESVLLIIISIILGFIARL
jgi:hypothetical protein